MNEDDQQYPAVPDQPLAIAEGLLSPESIQRAEIMVDQAKKIKSISARVTNPDDWTIQNGKPYLQNSGCMKIANLWGVSFRDRKFVPESGELREDERGAYFMFTVEGKAEFKGRTVEDIGTCSTRDDFFGTTKDKDGKRILKSLGDVDMENIKKKAVTNLQGRLLKKVLGLSYTLDELKAVGVDLSRSAQVNYAGGGAGGGKISDAQQKRLFAILMRGAEGEENKRARQDMLRSFLKANFKVEHSKDLERPNYDAACVEAERIAASLTIGA